MSSNTRRAFLRAAGAAATAAVTHVMAAVSRSGMGIVTTSYMTARKFRDTYEFLEHCASLGAAGIQAPINGDARKIRTRAGNLNMFVEAIVPMPRDVDMS